MSRQKIEIDWNNFEKLCGLHCTLSEISAFFHCSDDTIERAVKRQYKKGFAEVFRQRAGGGKISLRRKMMEMALKGNVTLLIWLSKNHLNMTDKHDATIRQDRPSEVKITWQVASPPPPNVEVYDHPPDAPLPTEQDLNGD